MYINKIFNMKFENVLENHTKYHQVQELLGTRTFNQNFNALKNNRTLIMQLTTSMLG